MKKLPFFSWFAVGVLLISSAQLTAQDNLYLKDGSILKGKLLKAERDTFKIELAGGSIFIFDSSEVSKFKMGAPPKPVEYHTGGIHNHTETGSITQTFDPYPYSSLPLLPPIDGFSIRNITTYQFTSWLSTGLGVGYKVRGTFSPLAPVFVDVRGCLLKNKPVTPYYFLDGGYSFFVHNGRGTYGKYFGGWFSEGGVGVRFFLGSPTSMGIGIGYEWQRTRSKKPVYDYNGQFGYERIGFRIENHLLRSLNIRAILSF